MRTALRYARSGPARFISHLDMQRAFGRAIRRARIPALYSQGFNPHLIMSFASPLSVGYATESDYLELEVADDMDIAEAFEALYDAMPPGIELRGMFRIPDGTKKLMALNGAASYEVEFECTDADTEEAIDCAVKSIVSDDEHICRDRKGRELNLAELIYGLETEGRTIHMLLANASGKSLNPGTVADEICRIAGVNLPYSVCRTQCYAEQNGEFVPFKWLMSDTHWPGDEASVIPFGLTILDT